MTEEKLEKEREKLEAEIKDDKDNSKNSVETYYERALELQAKKIDCQATELARMNRVYSRNVRSAKISEAFSFLISVIINKIKN